MIPQCIDMGVGVIPWSPLARGFLTGTRTRDGGKHTVRANTDAFVETLYTRACRLRRGRPGQRDRRGPGRGRRPGGAGMAAAPPGVTAPIVGATRVSHVQDALAAEQL